jgi:hypothetical protein
VGAVDEEEQLGATRAPQPNAIAMAERLFRDLHPVDKRSAPGAAIPQDVLTVTVVDFRMVARNLGFNELQVVGRAASDGEEHLLQGHDTMALRTDYFEPDSHLLSGETQDYIPCSLRGFR